MGVIVRIIIGLAILAAVILAIGLTLPKSHRATSRISLEKSPEEVWSVIRDPAALVGIWSELKSARQVQRAGGREVWEQNAGGFPMRLIIESANPPRRLVTRIDADEKAAFGGTWTYTLTPTGHSGTTLSIVEDGYINNPVFRVMIALIGKHRTLDGYLKALADKFDEAVKPEHVN
jgi:uncharacterized protein YndB with AHSA1/START domain